MGVLMEEAQALLAYQHGRRWRKRCGTESMKGALLMARGLFDLHVWVESHKKRG